MNDEAHSELPRFHIRKTRDEVWYVVADWPDDGAQMIKACASEEECRHWIATRGAAWAESHQVDETKG
jgi:hypothetical protein